MVKFTELLLFTVGLLPLVSGFLIKNWPVTAKGCVKCYGNPMRYVKIRLMDDDPIVDDAMKTGRAEYDGCFTLSGSGRDGLSGKPKPYIKVEYQYSGSLGQMDVEGLVLGANHGGSSDKKTYAPSINFGDINFDTIRCKAYTVFYDAMQDFHNRADVKVPVDTLHIRTGVLLHGGTAYTTTDTVRLPGSYTENDLTDYLAQHELSHAVRHTLDGNSAHFIFDVARFFYTRNHHCGLKSNLGYAFNEGWAEYWEDSCHGVYGNSPQDYNYEGNVAKGLRSLKSSCNSSDKKFVEVLRQSSGQIHSFAEFNDRHKDIYNCKM